MELYTFFASARGTTLIPSLFQISSDWAIFFRCHFNLGTPYATFTSLTITVSLCTLYFSLALTKYPPNANENIQYPLLRFSTAAPKLLSFADFLQRSANDKLEV